MNSPSTYPLLVIERSQNPIWGLPFLIGVALQIKFAHSTFGVLAWASLGVLQVVAVLVIARLSSPRIRLMAILRSLPSLCMWLIFAVFTHHEWIRIYAMINVVMLALSFTYNDGKIEMGEESLLIKHLWITTEIQFADIARVEPIRARVARVLAWGGTTVATVKIIIKPESKPLNPFVPWSRSLSLNVPQDLADSFIYELDERLESQRVA